MKLLNTHLGTFCGKSISQPAPTSVITGNKAAITTLVVDDDQTIRDIFKEMLTLFGHRVLLAEDGQKALAIFKKHFDTIDIAILDIIMPGMHGDVLCEKLKAICPFLKVIVCSGHYKADTKDRLLKMGVTQILEKPIQLRTLRRAIDNIMTC